MPDTKSNNYVNAETLFGETTMQRIKRCALIAILPGIVVMLIEKSASVCSIMQNKRGMFHNTEEKCLLFETSSLHIG